jgi:hypothetical protein
MFCSARCRQSAHRKPVTDKPTTPRSSLSIRDAKRLISIALDRQPAVFLNDLLVPNRTSGRKRAYQVLCRASRMLEDSGEIGSFNYWSRYGKPGFVVLTKPGHEVKNPKEIALLKDADRRDLIDQCVTAK